MVEPLRRMASESGVGVRLRVEEVLVAEWFGSVIVAGRQGDF